MKVGVIGCGYVFDKYLATWGRHPDLIIAGVTDIDEGRIDAVTRHYGLKGYANNAALLADPEIDIVANFTPIKAHYDVTKAALEAGKHVYCEKPLVTRMDQARELFSLAESRGLRLSCAPSNALGGTTQSMWKAVVDGAIGKVRAVYAEYDADPCYLVSTSEPEETASASSSFPYLTERSTVSVTGAPFPFLKEFEMGCTYEHVGYHLTWMCAIFGPVRSVTAFSKEIMPDKTDRPLDPPNTPDFSVAALDFHSGVVGRITCSINGVRDVSMRVIGDRGILSAETYADDRCPVYMETFSRLSIKAMHLTAVCNSPFLQWLFGIGARRVPLVGTVSAEPGRQGAPKAAPWDLRRRMAEAKQRQLNRQDKCIGIAELAQSLSTGRPNFPPHDFTLHLTELTIAIQGAGTESRTHVMETTFAPIDLPQQTSRAGIDYNNFTRSPWRTRLFERVLAAVRG